MTYTYPLDLVGEYSVANLKILIFNTHQLTWNFNKNIRVRSLTKISVQLGFSELIILVFHYDLAMFETIIQEHDTYRCIRPTIKACTCASGTCSLHEDSTTPNESLTSIPRPAVRRSSVGSLRRQFEKDELKLSLSSLVSERTEQNSKSAKHAAEVYEKWLAEKEEHR